MSVMTSQNLTVLLVEDDPNDALFMKMAFEGMSVRCQLNVAEDGKEALAYLTGEGEYADRSRHPMPYLMLLDLKLPRLMGLDVLQWVRSRKNLRSLIVIVLTSSSNPEDVDKAYALGANAYVVKPTSFDKLEILVASIRDFWLTHNQPASVFLETAVGRA